MLTNGLDILRILAEAEEPLTATAIATRVGIHVSNVSRTLRVLMQHGYVRKPSYHSFAVDLGVLSLAGSAAMQLPAIAGSKDFICNMAKASGLECSLAALHHDQVLYLHRFQPNGQGISAVAGGYPLHLSVVGLRLLLNLPHEQALTALEAGARRYGWELPSPQTPCDPASCLVAANQRLGDGILQTNHWQNTGYIALAIDLQVANHPPLALSLHGSKQQGQIDPHQQLRQAAKDLTAILEQIP